MFHQLALIGTTASGKSSLAIQIARKFNGVILSLDSLALYKQIDIASAKPSKSELELVKHFGVNEIYVNEVFSVGMFFKIYQNSLKWAQDNGYLLIITGGSGFYLKAMLSGLTPDVPKCEIPSNEEIYSLARKIDGDFAMKFSQNDSYRLEKWYQIYKFSNEIPSIWLKKNTGEPLIKELEIYEILWPTQAIRERIKERTHQMFKQGLLDEAKFLFDTYGYEQKALKSIGLKECAQYFRGEISNVAELEELITIHTTQLAKRQRTFNRSQFEKEFIGEPDAVEDVLIKRLEGLV